MASPSHFAVSDACSGHRGAALVAIDAHQRLESAAFSIPSRYPVVPVP